MPSSPLAQQSGNFSHGIFVRLRVRHPSARCLSRHGVPIDGRLPPRQLRIGRYDVYNGFPESRGGSRGHGLLLRRRRTKIEPGAERETRRRRPVSSVERSVVINEDLEGRGRMNRKWIVGGVTRLS